MSFAALSQAVASLSAEDAAATLVAALAADDPVAGMAFATRDGTDETVEDVLTAIATEEAALKALRACL